MTTTSSTPTDPAPQSGVPAAARPAGPPKTAPPRTRRARARSSLLASGEPMLWLTGGSLLLATLMIVGLLGLILSFGLSTFWPLRVQRFVTVDNHVYMGEVTRDEHYQFGYDAFQSLSDAGKEVYAPRIHAELRASFGQLIDSGRMRQQIELVAPPLTLDMLEVLRDRANAQGLLADADHHPMPVGSSAAKLQVISLDANLAAVHAIYQQYAENRDALIDRLIEQVQQKIQADPSGFALYAHYRSLIEAPLPDWAALSDADDVPAARQLTLDQLYPYWAAVMMRYFVADVSIDAYRQLVRTANYRLTGTHFQWVDPRLADEPTVPEWAVVFERTEWGRFYGFPHAFVMIEYLPEGAVESWAPIEEQAAAARKLLEAQPVSEDQQGWLYGQVGDERVVRPFDKASELDSVLGVGRLTFGQAETWAMFNEHHHEVLERIEQRKELEEHDVGIVNARLESARLAVREAELAVSDAQAEGDPQALAAAEKRLADARANQQQVEQAMARKYQAIKAEIEKINQNNARYRILMETAGEGDLPAQMELMPLSMIVRAYPANQLTTGQRFGVYFSRWNEFLTDNPREANQEGGVFPAIFGTILMTILLALAVVPFGVLAALYMREYAKAGPVISAVRIAVNNLAGVPSIVFGVFGLGFFCYIVGAYLDGGPDNAFGAGSVMPTPRWFMMLGAASVIGFVAFLTAMGSMHRPGTRRRARHALLYYVSMLLWLGCVLSVVILVATTPFFDGFYRANLPNPTFGKGALVWASLTLALLTLPVVIVATEEALSAVPNSMREGSYACGASKWQTIKRIVLPRAMPGIMTGMILAMARGAGEVAPLMLVGAVKLTEKLPFEWTPPFGVNRSFMHLGFHIYDVGFQSPNAEAAKPMVYTTTLLLIAIVASLNIAAIWLRSRLRRKFVANQF